MSCKPSLYSWGFKKAKEMAPRVYLGLGGLCSNFPPNSHSDHLYIIQCFYSAPWHIKLIEQKSTVSPTVSEVVHSVILMLVANYKLSWSVCCGLANSTPFLQLSFMANSTLLQLNLDPLDLDSKCGYMKWSHETNWPHEVKPCFHSDMKFR